MTMETVFTMSFRELSYPHLTVAESDFLKPLNGLKHDFFVVARELLHFVVCDS